MHLRRSKEFFISCLKLLSSVYFTKKLKKKTNWMISINLWLFKLTYMSTNYFVIMQYGGDHTFKWLDEALMDEIQTLHDARFAQEVRMNLFTLGQDGIHVDPQVMWSRVQYLDDVMDDFKQHILELQESHTRWTTRACGIQAFGCRIQAFDVCCACVGLHLHRVLVVPVLVVAKF